jgi:mono/diheme cytochrome c family protein
MKRPTYIYIASLVVLLASSACVEDSSAAQAGQQSQARTALRDTAAGPQRAVRNPQPSFVEHTAYIRAGLGAPDPAALRLRSPFDRDPQVTAVGSQLYHSYNCIDCHGMDGSGAMGPSLADGRWRFGGSPAEVFESIYQGRPDGMPAWGGRISDADIWRLVAYVRSLEAGKNVSTENFTGTAQQRMGH